MLLIACTCTAAHVQAAAELLALLAALSQARYTSAEFSLKTDTANPRTCSLLCGCNDTRQCAQAVAQALQLTYHNATVGAARYNSGCGQHCVWPLPWELKISLCRLPFQSWYATIQRLCDIVSRQAQDSSSSARVPSPWRYAPRAACAEVMPRMCICAGMHHASQRMHRQLHGARLAVKQ